MPDGQSKTFDDLSRQATFIGLIGIIHKCVMNDPDLFKERKTRYEYVGPMLVLADHLDEQGLHDAANNVRMMLKCGAGHFYITSTTVNQERVRDHVAEHMFPDLGPQWKPGDVVVDMTTIILPSEPLNDDDRNPDSPPGQDE